MYKAEDLLDELDLRQELVERTDVLDKVKELHTLPGTEYMTTRQVADFYDVRYNLINLTILRNEEEIEADGVLHLSGQEVLDTFVNLKEVSKRVRGGIQVGEDKLAYSTNTLYSKRAVLRIGMLLRDSEVAKEVRSLLLNTYHDIQEGKENIHENITREYDEELSLYTEYGKAIAEGRMDKVVEITTQINEMKNKRIKETEEKLAKSEEEKKEMAVHSTTIQETKQVIRRIVNVIAYNHYGGNYVATWAELHNKANYMLGINIKARTGQGSLFSKYTDEELRELEVIAKNWAVKQGHSLEEILQLN